MKKVVIFSPFWGCPGHIGTHRIDRFVRWLRQDGIHVVIVRAGTTDDRRETPWGLEIAVRDPLRVYRQTSAPGGGSVTRRPNKLRRWLAYWLFNPDPGVVWARRAARHPETLRAAIESHLILSSSPPESAHVGAWLLSRTLNRPLLVDMRDGWLDEPLKPIILNSALRRWSEGRLEAKILKASTRAFVTSEVWQRLLVARKPDVTTKTTVLTNGYPQAPSRPAESRSRFICEQTSADARLVLMHAGRFSGSRLTQSPELLLRAAHGAIERARCHGDLLLLGALSKSDVEEIGKFQSLFSEQGWTISCPGVLPREELLDLLPKASGLLLLSNSHAAVPSKLFEYIPTRRPILVVTQRNSATWNICKQLPQAFICTQFDDLDVTGRFISAAKQAQPNAEVPHEYTEEFLSKIFLDAVHSRII